MDEVLIAARAVASRVRGAMDIALDRVDPFQLGSDPGCVTLLLRFVGYVTQRTRRVRLVVFRRLFSVPPSAVRFAREPFAASVLLRPFQEVRGLIFFKDPRLNVVDRPSYRTTRLRLSGFQPREFSVPYVHVVLVAEGKGGRFFCCLFPGAFPNVDVLVGVLGKLRDADCNTNASPDVSGCQVYAVVGRCNFGRLQSQDVLKGVAVRLCVAGTCFKFRVFKDQVEEVVCPRVKVCLLVDFRDVIGRAFFQVPAPAFREPMICAVAEVFPSECVPLDAIPIAFPVGLATNVGRAFRTRVHARGWRACREIRIVGFQVADGSGA